jgi:zinc protease
MKSRLLGFASLIICGLSAPAQTALPNGVNQITSVEGITEYKLANGLELLVFPDPSKPT